jgi:hypothetical protein
MTSKTREDIFIEKLSRLLQENRTKNGEMLNQSRTPKTPQQRTVGNRQSEDLRNETRKREV